MDTAQPTDPIQWVGKFEGELSLPPGFFINLMQKEDDWSFVIKLHALVEAAVAHLLATICGEQLHSTFARLQLGGRAGKPAFAENLGLLEPYELAFIRKLSEIRNSFAHDVRRAGTSLDAYVAGLIQGDLHALKEAVGPRQDPFPIADPPIPEIEFVRDNPKLCIWLRALFLIAFIYQKKDLVSIQRQVAEERTKLVDIVLAVERLRRKSSGEPADGSAKIKGAGGALEGVMQEAEVSDATKRTH